MFEESTASISAKEESNKSNKEILHIEAFLKGEWHLLCELKVEDVTLGRSSSIEIEYQSKAIYSFNELKQAKICEQFPLGYFPYTSKTWPAFLYDLMPVAAARRYWQQQKDLVADSEAARDFRLLKQCTSAPLGNLRISESVIETQTRGFNLEEVVTQDSNFIDYAYMSGASITGALGAGGESLKFLLVEGKDGLYYLEGTLSDTEVDQHYIVKFARNESGVIDRQILDGESSYYQLAERLGFKTINTEEIMYFPLGQIEGMTKPSLWLPRFDREIIELDVSSPVKRHGMESLNSIMGLTQVNEPLRHSDAIRRLVSLWQEHGQEAEIPEMVAEYIKRDLLNVVLGNTNNHGGNLSILKFNDCIELAPIYDLSPMVLDLTGVERTLRWSRENEQGDQFNWHGICVEAAEASEVLGVSGVDDVYLWRSLKECAAKMSALPELVEMLVLDPKIANHAKIDLVNLPRKLADWSLIAKNMELSEDIGGGINEG